MYRGNLQACEACKSSKRKCTKQQPRCRRCDVRGLRCQYEPRPQMVVYQADEDGRLSRTRQIQQKPPSPPGSIILDPQLQYEPPSSDTTVCPSLDDLRSAWFLTEDAWKVSPVQTNQLTPISYASVQGHFDNTKKWLKDWISTGKNSWIHAELYSKGMPDCVQDAFMALSSYLSKTDKTADMVNRMLEDKAKKLIASQEKELPHGILEDIGRVQSLLIYCIVRLFDGNIRQRHFAERQLPVLLDWTKQMLLRTSIASNDGTLLLHNALTEFTPELTSTPPIPCHTSPSQLLWHAWILSESVRRTWGMSMMVQAGYELLKTGNGPCHGGVRTTTKRGIWDAESALTWMKLCSEGSVGFLHRNDTEALLTGAADEVDEFSLVIMELDFGKERMDAWRLGIEC
ncbi:hypothetical protein G7046_g1831 [Stylonectria norvegica]|nr:hypothetical protein G7046_g1831 [Stylonectria norvegica]